jgi:hypothetical protein
MSKNAPQGSNLKSASGEKVVRVYSSFEDENLAEHQRLAAMSHHERISEAAILQSRRWGESWGLTPIVRTASWERLAW